MNRVNEQIIPKTKYKCLINIWEIFNFTSRQRRANWYKEISFFLSNEKGKIIPIFYDGRDIVCSIINLLYMPV